MLVYWLMLFLAVFAALSPRRLPADQVKYAWWAVGVIFTLLIGFRHEVGADWFNYLGHFEFASQARFREVLERSDPGHYVVNWLVARAGGSVHWVNLLYGAVFMWGVAAFCRRQPYPWLALVVAVPYLIIVVGMGYSRQAAALGLALAGLAALGEQRVRIFVILVALGTLFHKSAVLLLPIAAVSASRNRAITIAAVGVTTIVLYYLLVSADADDLWRNYVEHQRHSQGAKIRVLMNAIPAALMLIWGKRLVPDPHERKLWVWISILALLCVPLVSLATTAVDRVALYLIPIQLLVFSRAPALAGSNIRMRTLLVLGVIAYYFAVLFVWLNFASHSEYWIPYQFLGVT